MADVPKVPGTTSWQDVLKDLQSQGNFEYTPTSEYEERAARYVFDPELSELPGTPAWAKALKFVGAAVNLVGGAVYSSAREGLEALDVLEEDERNWWDTYKDALEGEGFSDIIREITDYDEESASFLEKALTGVGGLALDIATDPLTWVSGAGLVSKAVLREASEKFAVETVTQLSKQATERVAARHVQDVFGDAAYEQALRLGDAAAVFNRMAKEAGEAVVEEAGVLTKFGDVGATANDIAQVRIQNIVASGRLAQGPRGALTSLRAELGDDLTEEGYRALFKAGDGAITGGLMFARGTRFETKLTTGGGFDSLLSDSVMQPALQGWLRFRSASASVFKNFAGRSGEDYAAFYRKLVADTRGKDLGSVIANRTFSDGVGRLFVVAKAQEDAIKDVALKLDTAMGKVNSIRDAGIKLSQQADIDLDEVNSLLRFAKRVNPADIPGKVAVVPGSPQHIKYIKDRMLKRNQKLADFAAKSEANAQLVDSLATSVVTLRKMDLDMLKARGVNVKWDFENRTISAEYRQFLREVKGARVGKTRATAERTGAFSKTTVRETDDGFTKDNFFLSVDEVNQLATRGEFERWARDNGFDNPKVFIDDELEEMTLRVRNNIQEESAVRFTRQLAKSGLLFRGEDSLTSDQVNSFINNMTDFMVKTGTVPTKEVQEAILNSVLPAEQIMERLGLDEVSRLRRIKENLFNINADLEKKLNTADTIANKKLQQKGAMRALREYDNALVKHEKFIERLDKEAAEKLDEINLALTQLSSVLGSRISVDPISKAMGRIEKSLFSDDVALQATVGDILYEDVILKVMRENRVISSDLEGVMRDLSKRAADDVIEIARESAQEATNISTRIVRGVDNKSIDAAANELKQLAMNVYRKSFGRLSKNPVKAEIDFALEMRSDLLTIASTQPGNSLRALNTLLKYDLMRKVDVKYVRKLVAHKAKEGEITTDMATKLLAGTDQEIMERAAASELLAIKKVDAEFLAYNSLTKAKVDYMSFEKLLEADVAEAMSPAKKIAAASDEELLNAYTPSRFLQVREGELTGQFAKIDQAAATRKAHLVSQAIINERGLVNLAPAVGDPVVLPKHLMDFKQQSKFFTHESVREALWRMYKVSEDGPSGSLLNVYDGMLSMFKAGATVLQAGVGFELRNMAGAMVNNMAGGVRTRYMGNQLSFISTVRDYNKMIQPGGEFYDKLLKVTTAEKYREIKAAAFSKAAADNGITLEKLGYSRDIFDRKLLDLKSDEKIVGELFLRAEEGRLFETRTFDAMEMEVERSIYTLADTNARMSAAEAIKAERRANTLLGKAGIPNVNAPITAAERFKRAAQNNRFVSPDATNGGAMQRAFAAKIQLNTDIEAGARLGAYFEGIARSGSTDYGVSMSRALHFDYSDLSDMEKKVMKRVVPFYTWVRRNTALQAQIFLLNPGSFSNREAIQHLAEDLFEDPDAASGTPEWLRQRDGFLGQTIGLTGTRLGIRLESPKLDFYNFTSGDTFGEALSGTSPVLKSLLSFTEGITGADMGISYGPLAGKSFTEYEMSDFLHLSGNFVPPVKQIVDDFVVNIGMDRKEAGSDEATGYRWPTVLSKLGVPVVAVSQEQQDKQEQRDKGERTRFVKTTLSDAGFNPDITTKTQRRTAASLYRSIIEGE